MAEGKGCLECTEEHMGIFTGFVTVRVIVEF